MAKAQLMTVREAAEHLGITRQTLQYHIALGRLVPEVKGPGQGPAGMMFFRESEVKRFEKKLQALRDAQLPGGKTK